MIQKITFFLLLITTLSTHASHIAVAENGLNLREAPSLTATKIGLVYFGAKVQIVEHTGVSLTITDNGKAIQGEWVKITFSNASMFISTQDSGYVFSGFLKPVEDVMAELNRELKAIPAFNGYSVDSSRSPFFVKGDFFGDKVADYAVMLKNSHDTLRIGIIDHGGSRHQFVISRDEDATDRIIDEFGWVGVFRKVKKGDVLWANWAELAENTESEGRRGFDEVPEKEKVVLGYDALFVHMTDACGGGFMYWNKKEFIWLQQE